MEIYTIGCDYTLARDVNYYVRLDSGKGMGFGSGNGRAYGNGDGFGYKNGTGDGFGEGDGHADRNTFSDGVYKCY